MHASCHVTLLPASSHEAAIPFYRQEHWGGGFVYEFPVATVTNDCKLGG